MCADAAYVVDVRCCCLCAVYTDASCDVDVQYTVSVGTGALNECI